MAEDQGSHDFLRSRVPRGFWKLAPIFILFLVGSVFLIFGTDGDAQAVWIGVLCLVIFGGGFLALIWAHFRQPSVVLSLSEDGVHHHLNNLFVPWHSIQGVSVQDIKGTGILVLEVTESEMAKHSGSAIAKGLRAANRLLGADGIQIDTSSLAINPNEVARIIAARAGATG
ncbi:MAG: STM3941 family protein [Pseudomonadota bacterium]